MSFSVVLSLLNAVEPFWQVAMCDETADQDQHACSIKTALEFEVVENLSEDRPNHHPHANGRLTGSKYFSSIFGETNCNHRENYML
jgi:hypothetical protein